MRMPLIKAVVMEVGYSGRPPEKRMSFCRSLHPSHALPLLQYNPPSIEAAGRSLPEVGATLFMVTLCS